ncbi:YdcF family protein [Chromobacterium violaceum]|uniref:YdcF family protein n=1 Tax=Chromobacterium violaceum TaxID=536 RepID=UPI001E3D9B72|nr:YdcF family protein [Chromobacterium violaceum]
MRGRLPPPGAWLAALGALALLAVLALVPLIRYSKSWLVAETPQPRADWIVVLGGESGERVIGAAELYHQGRAPFVFVSGEGDCLLIVRRLQMAGVPRGKIGYECLSNSTWQNAVLTRQALASRQPRRITLVTSWFHSRRALETFRQAWPEVEWGMHIVYPGNDLYHSLAWYEAGAVLTEYLKILVYSVRYWTFR